MGTPRLFLYICMAGLTPEGIDNSNAYFSLVLDAPWTPQPTAESWLQQWGQGRCGRADVPQVSQAYELLFNTVYRPEQPYLWCCSLPKFCPTVLPDDHSVARPAYNVSMLRQALELMVVFLILLRCICLSSARYASPPTNSTVCLKFVWF